MREHQLPLNVPNRWFEKRRDFFVRQLIDDFFSVKLAFQETYLVYLECRNAGSSICSDLLEEEAVEKRRQLWDRLVRLVGAESDKGPLWHLKDQCHMAWPEDDSGQDSSGSLIDWLIGSIFHETMKLKENIYLLNRYGPAACRMKNRPWDGNSFQSSEIKQLGTLVDVQRLISRAAGDAVNQMEQIAFLVSHASYMLRLKLPALANNALIVRLLVEKEESVRLIWGETVTEIFSDMFFEGPVEGFCMAGRSYFSGQWFEQALAMYKRALDVSPTCDEAVTRLAQLQEVVKENRELLGVS